jgi:hypothetical protein
MKGDFSRFTYSPLNNYLGILKQQGRVDLDSDWNEQTEIISEYLRQLTSDILGHFAVPLAANDITNDNSQALKITDYSSGPGGVIDFKIGRGLGYVGGYPLLLPKDIAFRSQPDYPEAETPVGGSDLLVFIEAWKKTINYIDDETIREPALGGPDTSLRAKLVGQVKVIMVNKVEGPHEAYEFINSAYLPANVVLTLQIDQSAHQIPMSFGEVDMGGGMIPGNLHYRIEFHRGIMPNGDIVEGVKWSDENAATVVRALKSVDGSAFLVEEPEQVTGESFKEGDWVEVSNTVTELQRQGSQMARIISTESADGGLLVRLDTMVHPLLARFRNGGRSALPFDPAPRLRRWSGYVEPLAMKTVYNLGHGIKLTFHSTERKYRIEPGDYWTYAIRDRDYNKRHAPQKAAPSGIRKYRHPLAIIKRDSNNQATEIIDCRRFFEPGGKIL